MESTVSTRAFFLDRGDYAKAKISVLVPGIWPAYVVLVALWVLVKLTAQDQILFAVIYSAFALMTLGVVMVIGITVSRIYSRKLQHVVTASRTMYFSENEVRVVVDGVGESTLNWSTFTGIQRVRSWTFVLQDRTPVLAVPDSAFSPSDLQVFRDLLERKKAEFKQRN